MKLKRFEGRKPHIDVKVPKPLVSIYADKRIALRTQAIQLLPKGTEHVELYFDESELVIGIKPVEAKTDYSYRLHSHAVTSRSICSRRFIDLYKLERFAKQSFPAEWSREHHMLLVRLKEKAPPEMMYLAPPEA